MIRFAKFYWTIAFLAGTAATVAVNTAHAAGVFAAPGTRTAMAVAAAPPLVFVIVTEGYFLVRRSVPTRVQRVVKLSAGALAASAFAVSYETSRLFVIAQPGPLPEWVGWVIPGMVDVLVAVAAYILFVLNAHGGATSVAPRQPSRWSRIAGNLGDRMVAATMAPQPSVISSVGPSTDATESSAGTSMEPATEDADSSVEASVDAPAEAPRTRRKPSVERPRTTVKAPAEPSVDSRFRADAEWMTEQQIVRGKPVGFYAAILEAIHRGDTDNAIKRAGLSSAGSAAAVRSAWARYRVDIEAHPADRTLAAV